MSTTPHLDLFQVEYSLKNIPVGNKREYMIRLYDQTCKFIERLRWRVYWFIANGDNNEAGKDDSNEASKDTIEMESKFPTRKSPPPNDLIQAFEDDLFKLIKNIKFRNVRTRFQNQLRKDINAINQSDKVFAFADKTNNIYQMEPTEYKKLIHENITKDYRKAPDGTLEAINSEASNIVGKAKSTRRIPKFSTQPTFISIKDHKDGFPGKVKCRLLNPAKSSIAKISKSILDRIINDVRSKSELIQWRNAYEVIDWFKAIDKTDARWFVKFDIVEFYPSITKAQLIRALDFARQFSSISQEEENIIMHSCKTILADAAGEIWKKKGSDELFDVAMGSFHGAEVCDLLGLFILAEIAKILKKGWYGLYRDDGLAIVDCRTRSELERLRKSLHNVFESIGFRITIETGIARTDFLDVMLDLDRNEYEPYRKRNAKTTYIDSGSNHPQYIKKALPKMVHDRICRLSKNEAIYERARRVYDNALETSGHERMADYERRDCTRKKKLRKKKVTFFNPPYCSSVETNLGKAFLHLIDKHFTVGHPLRKTLSRSTLKLSYSCMPNMKSVIQKHSNKIL